jgi:hypothetical protein
MENAACSNYNMNKAVHALLITQNEYADSRNFGEQGCRRLRKSGIEQSLIKDREYAQK